MRQAKLLILVIGSALAMSCSESNSRMAGDNPVQDASDAKQLSPDQPADVRPSQPTGGMSTQPARIPTNPPENETGDH